MYLVDGEQVAVAGCGCGCRLRFQVAYLGVVGGLLGHEEEVELAVPLETGDKAHEHGAQLVFVHVVAGVVLGAGAANVGGEHNVLGRLFVHVGLGDFAVKLFGVGLLLLQGLGGSDLVADLRDVGLLLLQGLGCSDLVADLLDVGPLLLQGIGSGDLVADLLGVGLLLLQGLGAVVSLQIFLM